MSYPLTNRIGAAMLCTALASTAGAQRSSAKRPVTVADMVRMNKIVGDETYDVGPVKPAVFSRDGRRFAVLIQRGDLQRNTVATSILVFRADQAFDRPRPDTILTFASSSNRPAIANVQWLPGDTALVFLGERPKELPQVYVVSLKTRAIKALTVSRTVVLTYNLSPSGDRFVYVAEAPKDSAALEANAARGFVVKQEIRELFEGNYVGQGDAVEQEMFAVSLGDRRRVKIKFAGLGDCYGDPKISPNGRYATMACRLPAMPPEWRNYENGLRGFAVVPVAALIDLERGLAEPLIDAPWYRAAFEWLPDGSGVLARNTLLPFGGVDDAERLARRTQRATVVIDPTTRAMVIVARRDSLEVVRWDATGRGVVVRSTSTDKGELGFKREGSSWVSTSPASIAVTSGGAGTLKIDVLVEEDLNTPPRIVATNGSGKRAVVFDPNPQFAQLAFGREEVFHWNNVDGQWEAGLYYPVGFAPGKRYPLVIQTHGFSPERFQIEGYATTGYAAQALAGAGIVVLQVGDGPRAAARRTSSSAEEGPFNVRGLEAAIDTLDKMGLIDRSKVALEGWSRTTYHVRYMLTHSSYPIAAALISDGVDFSYLRYLIDSDLFRTTAEGMNGGIPVGDTMRTWRERVPSLNPDKIKAPVRIESIPYPDGGGPLTQWELYTLLKRLNKPVELVYYPRGQHQLLKPWERMSSQGGAFDWFRFWLKGEEDSDPAKKEQYERWRAMRKIQGVVP